MAKKRMFSMEIVDSDAFLDMPISSQLLYFHLNMRADDDGFVNAPRKIMKFVGSSEDDIKLLIAKKFLIPFENGIVVIKHWRIHNYISRDRYKETNYKLEKSSLSIDENGSYSENVPQLYTECIQNVDTDKIRLDKNRLDKSNNDEKKPIKKTPTYEEVIEYAEQRGRKDIAKLFFDYYEAGSWKKKDGKPVLAWKQQFITWESHNPAPVKTAAQKELEPIKAPINPLSEEERKKKMEEMRSVMGNMFGGGE